MEGQVPTVLLLPSFLGDYFVGRKSHESTYVKSLSPYLILSYLIYVIVSQKSRTQNANVEAQFVSWPV